MEIKIGDRIQVTGTESTKDEAIGVVFEVQEIHNPYTHYVSGKVLERPNGWRPETIRHTFKPDHDILISLGAKNSELVSRLEKEDDF